MEESLLSRLQSEVEHRLLDSGDFEQEVVLLDRGAASALRWVLFGVEHSAAAAAATTTTTTKISATNAAASAFNSRPHTPALSTAPQRQRTFRKFLGRCFDLEQWKEVVTARRPSADARVTVVVSDFLWNYEKILSDVARLLQSSQDSTEPVGDGVIPDASRITLRVLSCLTEQAHNCHPQTAVLGSLDFLQFQAQLQQISNSARSAPAPPSATAASPTAHRPSPQSTVIVRVEHLSLPCLPVLATSPASLKSTTESSSITLDSYAPLEVVLSSWPRVVETCPALLSHVDYFDNAEDSDPLSAPTGVATHSNSHAPHGNSKYTPSSAGAISSSSSTSNPNGRRTTAAELPTSTLKSLSLVAHNVASMVRTFKLKVDDDHIWAHGGSASLIARKVRELLHTDIQHEHDSDSSGSQPQTGSSSLTSAIAAAAREAENRPVPATLLVVDQCMLPASASDNEVGGLLDGLQICPGRANLAGTLEVEFNQQRTHSGNPSDLDLPPLFSRVSESTEKLGFWESSLLNQVPEHRALLLSHIFLRSPKQLLLRSISLLRTELGSSDPDRNSDEGNGDTPDGAFTADRAPLSLVAQLEDLLQIARSKHAESSIQGNVLFAAHVLNLWHELDSQPRWTVPAPDNEETLSESLITDSWWKARIPDFDACTTPLETVQSSLLEVFARLCSARPTGAQLDQVFACEGFQSFSFALENLLMKDPVVASKIVRKMPHGGDEFSRNGTAGDAFVHAEDMSSGDEQDELGEDRRRDVCRFFLQHAFWRMGKAQDAVIHQSRINSSHQSNHGASQIDNRGSPIGQRIGSENTVADAIHVALSASMGSELEDTDQVDRKGGRPNSGARWIKVSSSGAYSLEGIRAAGVNAISGFFGWGKTKEKPKAKSPLPKDRNVVFVFIVGGLSGSDVAAVHRALALHNKTHAGIGSETIGHQATNGSGQTRILVGSNAVCSPSRTYHNIFEYSAADATS